MGWLWRRCCLTLASLGGPAFAQGATAPPMSILERAVAEGEFGRLAALAAEQHDAITYRKRFDGKPPGDPVDIRSARKSLTALAVGAAIADGKLPGVDLKVWPYLGASRGEPFDSITARDLLTMSSALDCFDGDARSPGQEEKMYRSRDWKRFVLALPARKATRDATGLYPWSYCTAGVFLLGQVVEKAVGEPFDRYVQRRLLDPLGIHSVIWRRSPIGQLQAGGQLRIADADLLKLGRLVLDRGRWRGEAVLPAAWIAQMLEPHRQLGPNAYYGYLWWAFPLASPAGYQGAWAMQGNGGNYVAIVRDYDAVLVVQAQNYNNPKADRWSIRALEAMLAAMPRAKP